MALLCGWSSAVKLCHFRLPTSPTLQISGRKKHPLLCSLPILVSTRRKKHSLLCNAAPATRRRDALLYFTFSALVAPTFSSLALPLTDAPPEFRLYSDDTNKYQISIPQDWQVGAGKTDGVRSITAFYPQLDSASNVSVLITGIGPDFTRMESFGNVDAFAETLVSGLDRSWQRPPGVAAKLIDSKASKGLYYIEYTLQKPGESRRHIYSAIGMANNGWYNRLYTVTGQYVDEEADKYSSMIEKAVKSFRFS